MTKVGIIGWRGMVGSVLMARMRAENDFPLCESTFFSTSQAGDLAPQVEGGAERLADAYDCGQLAEMEVLVSCQGGEYTKRIYPQLRQLGWTGYWLDASSALRMHDDSLIVLDPVNGVHIQNALQKGVRNYVGGNCTVSLLLMALAGLLEQDVVEWISTMTYQAASGAGARHMRELLRQMHQLGQVAHQAGGEAPILELDAAVTTAMRSSEFPRQQFGAPLAGSLLPWIDSPMPGGQTREEWKGQSEAQRILNLPQPLPIDGLCVRIGSMRCHAQGLTIKLKRAIAPVEVEAMLADAHQWIQVVPNEQGASMEHLTPAAVSGTLTVPIGRIHALSLGAEYIGAFTVGDQLLWGAAEPIRRMLRILLAYLD